MRLQSLSAGAGEGWGLVRGVPEISAVSGGPAGMEPSDDASDREPGVAEPSVEEDMVLSPHPFKTLEETGPPQDTLFPPEIKPLKRKSGFFSTTANMINTIIGAGVLALPFALAKTGVVLGLILLLVIAVMSGYTGFLLVDVAKKTKSRTYAKLGELAFGKYGMWLTDVMLCLLLLAACIGYLLIIGDIVTYLITRVVDFSPILLKRIVIFLAGGFLGLLTSFRTMTSLAKTSVVALMAVSYITFTVALRGIQSLLANGFGDILLFTFQKETLGAVPLIGFALSFHMGLFPILCEASSTTFMKPVICLGLTFCCAIYAVVGVFGYLTFLSTVTPNVIDAYPSSDIFAQFARGAVVVLVSCSFPLLAFPVRIILDRYLFIFRPYWNLHKFNPRIPDNGTEEAGQGPPAGPTAGGDEDDDNDEAQAVNSMIPDDYKGFGWRLRLIIRKEEVRRMILAYGITLFCVFWAIVIPNIAVIFGVAGATCGTMLIFVFPCTFFMKMQGRPWYHWKNIPPIFVCIFGIVVLGIGGLYAFYLELSTTPFPEFTLV